MKLDQQYVVRRWSCLCGTWFQYVLLEAGCAYARLAKALISELLELVEAEFAKSHGRVPGGEAVVNVPWASSAAAR